MRGRTLLALPLAFAAAAACESDLQFRPPERPTRVSVAGAPMGLTVRFAAAEDATGYALYVTSSGEAAETVRVECEAPPCEIEGLSAAMQYAVRVTSLDRTGESAPSAAVSARTLTGDEIITRRAWEYDFGEAVTVAGPGDLDGDGPGELFVGAPEGDGRVLLFKGSESGPEGQAIATFDGPAASRFGAALARAGDVNEDGFADIAIGAPGSADGDAGRVQLFRGGLGGFGAPAWSGSTFEAGSDSGSAIASGDVNGDGLTDVVSAAPSYVGGLGSDVPGAPSIGRVDLYLGPGPSAGALFLSVDYVVGVGTNEGFGTSIALADLDADGFDDLVVGAPFYDAGEDFELQEQGRVYAFRWNAAAESFDDVPVTLEGLPGRSLFGLSVSAAGDTDGDGIEEVLVGAPGAFFSEGAAVLYEGAPGFGLVEIWRREGTENAEEMGTSVAGGFDLNRDGFSDVAVGRPGIGVEDIGEVLLFYGSRGGLSRERVFDGRAIQERFGARVAPAGDVNGDGFDDVVAASASGRVEVVTGGRPATSPVVDAGYPLQGAPGATLSTTAAGFVDDVPEVTWTCVWEWGDGTADTLANCGTAGATASHAYAEAGDYDVRLRVLASDSRMGEAITGASVE